MQISKYIVKKKIAILISGGIRIYPKNKLFLNKIFKDFDIQIVSCVWKSQRKITQFKNLYKIKYIKYINLKNWQKNISKIHYVTGEENRSYKSINIFHMWHSITENLKFLKKISIKKKFDYVCRFRSDLYSKTIKINLTKEILNLKNNQILFPENNHYRGINDQFFITKYSTFLKFKNIFKFINSFLKEKRTFNPEYLFYCFIKKNNFKYKLIEGFNIKVLGQNLKSHRNYKIKPTKPAFIPLKDKINIKIIKYHLRFIKLKNKIKNI